jgi:hypothetical protein
MTHIINLKLNVIDNNTPIEFSGTIEDSEWELLNLFTQYAEELFTSNWAKNGFPASMNIHWEQGSNAQVDTQLPLWDDVEVFLHRLRPFILQNEETNFYRITNYLYKLIDQPFLRSFIADQREYYSGKMMQNTIKISSNDVLINSEKVLLDWLNAYEYHRDSQKKVFIDELHQMFPLEASKVLFLQQLSDKAAAIHNMTGFIRVILKEQTKFDLKIKKTDQNK